MVGEFYLSTRFSTVLIKKNIFSCKKTAVHGLWQRCAKKSNSGYVNFFKVETKTFNERRINKLHHFFQRLKIFARINQLYHWGA